MSRFATCDISCASTAAQLAFVHQLQESLGHRHAACCGLRPVANAFGCGMSR